MRWTAAWAVAAWAPGCSPRTQQVGEVAACAAPFCDAGTVDAAADAEPALPIGPSRYPDLDPEAFERTAEGMLGVWSGITVTLDRISSVFELRFEPGEQPGEGRYTGKCLKEPTCALFGQFTTPWDFGGQYRLWYVNSQGVGEGNLAWNVSLPGSGIAASWKMRNLLLRDQGEILYFVLDSPAGGTSVVLTRGPYVGADAGLDADAGQPDADAGGLDAAPSGPDGALDRDAGAGAAPSNFDGSHGDGSAAP